MGLGKSALIKRLESYWKMELASVFLIPGVCLFLCGLTGTWIGLFGCAGLLVMCVLLAIGAGYWRAKTLQLRGDTKPLKRLLFYASVLHLPLLVMLIGLALACAVDFVIYPIARNTGERVVAMMASMLALLEYVNYYQIQLQHFDHMPDFRRLLSGNGFRRSKMRLDLQRQA
ncbi:MAG: hypothetical protein AAF664_22250 [Planctomycetota bacterium]